jgi:methionyl-tRNA formyltransferase
MKIMYIGSSGALSILPLRYLLEAEHSLCAVGVDAHQDSFLRDTRLSIIAAQNESVEMLARMAGVPLINLRMPLADCVRAIREVSPDILLVSCFGRRLPQEILDIPAHGCFNFHPSMLPAYRGPVPGFWQFRDGVENFGVSLHRMTVALDAGAIVAQRNVAMPDGVSNQQASELIAQAYVDLLPNFVSALASGNGHETVQDESAASYRGYPQAEDFRVDTHWPARRIYNFMRATQHWGFVYPCAIDGVDYPLQIAHDFSEAECPDKNLEIDADVIRVTCQPGVLTAGLALV